MCFVLCLCISLSYSSVPVWFGAIATLGAIAISVMSVLRHYLFACSRSFCLWFMQYLFMVLDVPVPVSYYRRLFFMFSQSLFQVSHSRSLMTDHFSIVLFCCCLTELHFQKCTDKLICLCNFVNAKSDTVLEMFNFPVK